MNSLTFLVEQQRIWIYAYVIMPNHIHLLWRKQELWKEKNIQQLFLKYTAQQLKFSLIDSFSPLLEQFKSTQSDREYHFWERRPYKASMVSRRVLEQKLDYIHNNPVKAGLCKFPEDYTYSSARFYLYNEFNPLITHYMEHI